MFNVTDVDGTPDTTSQGEKFPCICHSQKKIILEIIINDLDNLNYSLCCFKHFVVAEAHQ